MNQATAKHKKQEKHTSQGDGLPSTNVRTTVNLLLFMHLFSLGVVFIWQTNTSDVSVQLHNVPAGYLKPLHMDVAFDDGHAGAQLTTESRQQAIDVRHRDRSRRAMLHFTHGGQLDDELFLELEYESDGQTETLPWPPAGVWPQSRRERFERIAWELARTSSAAGAGEEFSEGLSQSLLNQFDLDDGQLRVVRFRAQTIDEARSTDALVSDPRGQRYREVVIDLSNDLHAPPPLDERPEAHPSGPRQPPFFGPPRRGGGE